jgi:hypothetical protein
MGQTLIGTNLSDVSYATATSTLPVLGGGRGFTVGARITDYNGKEYVFVQANSAVSAYNIASLDSGTGVITALQTSTSAASEALAVPQFAFASGDYGWAQVYGACKVKVLGACAKSVTLYSTATAGSLDDATASNYEIRGVQILSTNPSATATAMSAFISWPKVRILPGVL